MSLDRTERQWVESGPESSTSTWRPAGPVLSPLVPLTSVRFAWQHREKRPQSIAKGWPETSPKNLETGKASLLFASAAVLRQPRNLQVWKFA